MTAQVQKVKRALCLLVPAHTVDFPCKHQRYVTRLL